MCHKMGLKLMEMREAPLGLELRYRPVKPHEIPGNERVERIALAIDDLGVREEQRNQTEMHHIRGKLIGHALRPTP